MTPTPEMNRVAADLTYHQRKVGELTEQLNALAAIAKADPKLQIQSAVVVGRRDRMKFLKSLKTKQP